jgi:hypothetical protein
MENKVGKVEAISHTNKSVKIDNVWSNCAPEIWELVKTVSKGSTVEWDCEPVGPNKNILSWFKVRDTPEQVSQVSLQSQSKHSKDDQIVMQACLKVAAEVLGWDIQQRKDMDSPVIDRTKAIAKELFDWVKDGDY